MLLLSTPILRLVVVAYLNIPFQIPRCADRGRCQARSDTCLNRGRSSSLQAARSRVARLEYLERSKDVLLSHYASLVLDGLAELTSEEKNRVYKMMRLKIIAHRDDALVADWGCNDASTLLDSGRILGR